MRLIFGVLSLLIVVAIIGTLAKKQLQALTPTANTRLTNAASQAGVAYPLPGTRDGATLAIPGGMAGAEMADPNAINVPQQARNIQQQFKSATESALQQGIDRNARAQP
jgi:hypothetical protein